MPGSSGYDSPSPDTKDAIDGWNLSDELWTIGQFDCKYLVSLSNKEKCAILSFIETEWFTMDEFMKKLDNELITYPAVNVFYHIMGGNAVMFRNMFDHEKRQRRFIYDKLNNSGTCLTCINLQTRNASDCGYKYYKD